MNEGSYPEGSTLLLALRKGFLQMTDISKERTMREKMTVT